MARLLPFLLFWCLNAHAETKEWSRNDTIRQGIVTSLFVADWRQTQHIVKNPGHYSERNPILGEHPSMRRVNALFILFIPGHAWVMSLLDSDTRKIVQRTYIVVEGYNVYRNERIFNDHERDGHSHIKIGYVYSF